MRVIPFVRTSINYYKIQRYQDLNWWEIPEYNLWKLPEFWDKCSSVSWLKFRRRLFQITSSLWPSFRFATADFPNYYKLYLRDDDIIIPTDDDDWFHPDIIKILPDLIGNAEFGHWSVVCNRAFKYFQIKDWRDERKVFPSNGYFLRGSMLRRVNMDIAIRMLLYHQGVGYYAVQHAKKIVDLSNHNLAIYNFHCGSCSAFGNIPPDIESFREIFPKNDIPEVPSEFKWAEEGIQEVNQFIKSLTKSGAS